MTFPRAAVGCRLATRLRWLPIASLLLAIVTVGFLLPGRLVSQDEETTDNLIELRNREGRAPKNLTIFSPLDLPTPNQIRTAMGLPGPDYWQQRVDYVMDVTLDAENDAVSGRETITYTNNSPLELPYLWFTLEQNLFAPDSEGSKFTPPGSRFNNSDGIDGGYKIESVKVGGEELEMQIYGTVGRLDLPEPVAAKGGQVQVEIAWSFNIPAYGVDRMGIKEVESGKLYEFAQWFPAVCKFDDVNGWNTLPYLGQGEFYTDFGSYEVTIRAPRSHVVCATGVLQNPEEVLTMTQRQRLEQAMDSAKTVMIRTEEEVGDPEAQTQGDDLAAWTFKADKVRTFAWTSSKATIWDAASITWEDGTKTLIQSVYPKEVKELWQESTQMLRISTLTYSAQWFRYPYPTATNVHGVCGGMEYPMIIFCDGSRSKRSLFGVTSHEIGHTWFPMVVNTDERRHPWMDEGFNTFINGYDTFAAYQRAAESDDLAIASLFPGSDDSSSRRGRRRNSRRRRFSQPIAWSADQIRPRNLGWLAYAKPAAGLRLLREEILGPERFDPAFKAYIEAWAFKSPQPADFFRCMENAAGVNLAWFWRGWYLEDTELDQAMVMVSPNEEEQTARLVMANKQDMVMPVYAEVEFDDGSTMDLELPVYVWHYTNVWTTEIATEGKKVVRVVLDPNGILPDSDYDNNEWVAEEPPTEDEAEDADDDKDDGQAAKQ